MKEQLRILITVKTYPIPSAKYGELVCTAGVTEQGGFVRLYPVNFRDQPYSRQYRKYQWIEVFAEKHRGRDTRKESYRPDCDTLITCGEPIPTLRGDWTARSQYVLKNVAQSLEELKAQQDIDKTSLGLFKPREILDIEIEAVTGQWKGSFLEELRQARIWDDRTVSSQPPRKVPFIFRYVFRCDDERCKSTHRIMIEDWEVGALYWRLVDGGATPQEAAAKVKEKFLGELCGPERDTHFFVGTVLSYPKSWVIIGVYWPPRLKHDPQNRLFD